MHWKMKQKRTNRICILVDTTSNKSNGLRERNACGRDTTTDDNDEDDVRLFNCVNKTLGNQCWIMLKLFSNYACTDNIKNKYWKLIFDTEDENFVAIKFWKIENKFEMRMNHDIESWKRKNDQVFE